MKNFNKTYPKWVLEKGMRAMVLPRGKRENILCKGRSAMPARNEIFDLIETYCSPPVDPLLVEARKWAVKAVAPRLCTSEDYKNGYYDHTALVQAFYELLKKEADRV